MSSTTSAIPTPSPTHAPSSSSSPSQSKPLLFFVALGFGVVFTNLWIIVGVKYCFRYNQRARQLAALEAEGGDALEFQAMQRPRRRREKKLMTMEDVNARFPLIKYKLWRAARVQDGLPAAGGVTAPPSRAGSIKEGHGLGRDSIEDAQTLHENEPAPLATSEQVRRPSNSDQKDFVNVSLREPQEGPSSPIMHEKSIEAGNMVDARRLSMDDAEDDEDDPIRTAVPAEMLTEPGDSCAICIDALEDEDEVRGLSCGHAFHASCLDPWLTSRRACCPLCKADYYVPKPRAEGDAPPYDEREHRAQMIPPASMWVGGRYLYTAPMINNRARMMEPPPRGGRVLIAGSRFTVNTDRYGFPVLTREPRHNHRGGQRSQQPNAAPGQLAQQTPATQESAPPTEGQITAEPAAPAQTSWFRGAFLNTARNVPFGNSSRNTSNRTTFGPGRTTTTQTAAAPNTSPGDLEAGVGSIGPGGVRSGL